MSKSSNKNAAQRRRNKALRRRTQQKAAKALRSARKAKDGSKRAEAEAKASDKRRRAANAARNRIEGKISACSSMKDLKALAKEVGVSGYSGWTAKQRSEAEATIIATALDLGIA